MSATRARQPSCPAVSATVTLQSQWIQQGPPALMCLSAASVMPYGDTNCMPGRRSLLHDRRLVMVPYICEAFLLLSSPII